MIKLAQLCYTIAEIAQSVKYRITNCEFVYQYQRLPVPAFTSTSVYQYQRLPVPAFTSTSVYQYQRLPVPAGFFLEGQWPAVSKWDK